MNHSLKKTQQELLCSSAKVKNLSRDSNKIDWKPHRLGFHLLILVQVPFAVICCNFSYPACTWLFYYDGLKISSLVNHALFLFQSFFLDIW